MEGFNPNEIMGNLMGELKGALQELSKAKETTLKEIIIDFGVGKPQVRRNDIESISTKKKYGFFGSKLVVIKTMSGEIVIDDMNIDEVKKIVYNS